MNILQSAEKNITKDLTNKYDCRCRYTTNLEKRGQNRIINYQQSHGKVWLIITEWLSIDQEH